LIIFVSVASASAIHLFFLCIDRHDIAEKLLNWR